jgi:hypothetical protein
MLGSVNITVSTLPSRQYEAKRQMTDRYGTSMTLSPHRVVFSLTRMILISDAMEEMENGQSTVHIHRIPSDPSHRHLTR